MDTRTPLYRPEGFKDSDKWALGPNGELIEWKWNSLPGDFCVDERGVESNTWTNSTTGVKCRITLLGEQENRDGSNTVTRSDDCTLPGEVDEKFLPWCFPLFNAPPAVQQVPSYSSVLVTLLVVCPP